MMRSMFSAISGLRAHQMMMDVVGNNIANVNTQGFKASMVTFQESLSQLFQAPGAGGNGSGGSNPIQVGLGVEVGAVDGIFSQGASQVTGRKTDVAIQGSGFFIVQDGGEQFFTRAGAFSFDADGNLTTAGGQIVQGWVTDPTTGITNTQSPVASLTMPLAQVIDPVVTTEVTIGGNLPSDLAVGDSSAVSINVYDSLGNAQELTVTMTKTASNAWTATGTINGTAVTLSPAAMTFDSSGNLTSAGTIAVSGYTPPGAAAMAFDLELGTGAPLVQFAGNDSMEALDQDGNAIGVLRDFAIADDGTIVGQFSNGWTRTLGQLALATFNNPNGLVRVGDSNFQASINSGGARIGEANTADRGTLAAGTLEMSNVELAREFTNLIIAQRGFQANSRIITASDEILQDLVNMKR